MTDKNYNQPRISINKVYTKKGDNGSTNIVGGHKVDKSVCNPVEPSWF